MFAPLPPALDGKSRNTDPVFSNQGDLLAYCSTRRNNADLDFYVMNPRDKSTDHLVAQNEGGGWAVIDWSSDDKQRLVQQAISINESYLWLMDVDTGKKTLLTPKGSANISYSPIGFSADGKSIYTATDRDNEFLRLARIDLATGQTEYLTTDPWDVEIGALSHNRQLLAYCVNENGLSRLHLLNLATCQQHELPAPKGVIGYLAWHENNHDLAFSVDSAHSPSDVFSIDINNNQVDRWTTSETGGLNGANFVEPELIKWKSFDGLEISGWLSHTEAYRRDLRRVEYGDERDPKMRELLESIAPMNHVQNLKKPIFIVAGANDPRVPKSEADQIVAALKQQGTPVWYLAAKDEGHGFAKKRNADFQLYATILFVQKYLLGSEN